MLNLRFALFLAATVAMPAAAQDEPIVLETPSSGSIDLRLFRAIYEIEEPAFTATMRGVNIASYPTFFIAVPAAGLLDVVVDGTVGAGTRMALSEIATMGAVFGMKNLIRRTRPYAALPDIERRPNASDEPPGGIDPFSFPSGHSAVAFSLATSLSLSFPEWYVIVPAMTWASATAVARIWHGMHYPSDILVGAVVGAGAGLIVHALFVPDEAALPADVLAAPPAFSFTVTF